jgi:hypothetical protein
VALSEGLTSAQNTQPSDPDEYGEFSVKKLISKLIFTFVLNKDCFVLMLMCRRPPVPQEDDAIKVVQHIGEPVIPNHCYNLTKVQFLHALCT